MDIKMKKIKVKVKLIVKDGDHWDYYSGIYDRGENLARIKGRLFGVFPALSKNKFSVDSSHCLPSFMGKYESICIDYKTRKSFVPFNLNGRDEVIPKGTLIKRIGDNIVRVDNDVRIEDFPEGYLSELNEGVVYDLSMIFKTYPDMRLANQLDYQSESKHWEAVDQEQKANWFERITLMLAGMGLLYVISSFLMRSGVII